MSQPKHILITGGAGYIGTVLVDLLLKQNLTVTVIDSLLHGDNGLRSFKNNDRFHFVSGDIRNRNDLDKAFKDVEAVVHLAAIVGEPSCNKDPKLTVEVNKIGSELLCEYALQNGVNRFVFVSTCSNYGVMTDTAKLVDETAELNPISIYAETKVGFENHLFNIREENFEPVVLRFSTAYGLSFRPRFDLTVNEFTRELLMNRKLEIYGEQFWRPYCHTVDLAKACLLAVTAEKDAVCHQAFNVGDSNENYQKQMIVEEILKQLPDRKHLVEFVKRNNDPRNYRVSFEKINSRLGFEISKTVPQGIDELIKAIESGAIENADSSLYCNV